MYVNRTGSALPPLKQIKGPNRKVPSKDESDFADAVVSILSDAVEIVDKDAESKERDNSKEQHKRKAAEPLLVLPDPPLTDKDGGKLLPGSSKVDFNA